MFQSEELWGLDQQESVQLKVGRVFVWKVTVVKKVLEQADKWEASEFPGRSWECGGGDHVGY